MKLPIPDDWDGESWQCIQVQWPDSVLYRGLLLGFLSYLTRGRIYDENSGSIKDAQAVGWQIWNRSYPLIPCCDDNGGEPPTPPPPTGGGFDFDFDLFGECEEDMAGVLDIKCEGGKLWKRMSPCCEWIEVCTLADLEIDAPDDDTVTPGGGEIENLACKKASQMVDVLYSVAEVVVEAVPLHMSLTWLAAYWYIKNHVEEAVSDLHWNWIYAATSFAALTWSIEFLTNDMIFEILPFNDRQKLKCKWVNILSGDTSRITDSEWNEMISTLRATVNVEAIPFLEPILRGIGKANMEWAATSARTLTEFDCDCPGVTVDPREDWPESEWSFWYDLKARVPANFTLPEGVEFEAGKGLKMVPEGTGYMSPEIFRTLTFAADTVIKFGYIKWQVLRAGTDYQGNKTYCKATDVAAVVWNGSNYPDVDPSAGGTFTKTAVVDLDVADGEHNWAWAIEANTSHGADESYMVYLQEIGLAGEGTSPLL